jgi:hypothetical protein
MAKLQQRIYAQILLAEYMGITGNELCKWCERYAGLFCEVENRNPEIAKEIASGELSCQTLCVLRDLIKHYDTGVEERQDSKLLRLG